MAAAAGPPQRLPCPPLPKGPGVVSWILWAILCHMQCWWSSGEEFYFLNALPQPLEVYWLPGGEHDNSEGMKTAQVPAGSPGSPGRDSINVGSRGHAFRVLARRRSAVVVHQGGGRNIVGVALPVSGDRSGLAVEVLGPKELRRLALRLARSCTPPSAPPSSASAEAAPGSCLASSEAELPTLKLPIPSPILAGLSKRYAAEARKPSWVKNRDQRDRLLFVSGLQFPVDIHWAWLAASAEDCSAGETEESKLIGTLKGAPTARKASIRALQAQPEETFFISAEVEGKTWWSRPFTYPGELFLVSVSLCNSSLDLELLDEDGMKVFLSDVARDCLRPLGEGAAAQAGAEAGAAKPWESKEFEDCLITSAVLPKSSVPLPSKQTASMFRQLWLSRKHWHTCSFQEPTATVDTRNFTVSDGMGGQRILLGDVLRREPLVVAVHGLATPEECADLESLAGDNLGMATTSSGVSRSRRTLSVNLYPERTSNGHSLRRLSARFFDIARQATGYDLAEAGQEPVNWLYYKVGYEYRPHCDGSCGTRGVPLGQRVASSLLYCIVAEDGGGTIFTRDSVKLTPTAGMMLLFTYNPDPHGLSEHAACPVLKGVKRTATQWYRLGVSAEEDWEAFNERGPGPARRPPPPGAEL